MRRTKKPYKLGWMSLLLKSAAPALLLTSSSGAWADQARDLCLDQCLRQAASEANSKWAQLYAFARVIIGTDGRSGYVSEPCVWQTDIDGVVCLASYRLSKTSLAGSPYAVSLDHFTYRITNADDKIMVSLGDLPPTLDGTELNMDALIAQFSVDGRPYADVLMENRERLRQRKR